MSNVAQLQAEQAITSQALGRGEITMAEYNSWMANWGPRYAAAQAAAHATSNPASQNNPPYQHMPSTQPPINVIPPEPGTPQYYTQGSYVASHSGAPIEPRYNPAAVTSQINAVNPSLLNQLPAGSVPIAFNRQTNEITYLPKEGYAAYQSSVDYYTKAGYPEFGGRYAPLSVPANQIMTLQEKPVYSGVAGLGAPRPTGEVELTVALKPNQAVEQAVIYHDIQGGFESDTSRQGTRTEGLRPIVAPKQDFSAYVNQTVTTLPSDAKPSGFKIGTWEPEPRFTSNLSPLELSQYKQTLDTRNRERFTNAGLFFGASFIAPVLGPAATVVATGLGMGISGGLKAGGAYISGSTNPRDYLLSPTEAFQAGATGVIFAGVGKGTTAVLARYGGRTGESIAGFRYNNIGEKVPINYASRVQEFRAIGGRVGADTLTSTPVGVSLEFAQTGNVSPEGVVTNTLFGAIFSGAGEVGGALRPYLPKFMGGGVRRTSIAVEEPEIMMRSPAVDNVVTDTRLTPMVLRQDRISVSEAKNRAGQLRNNEGVFLEFSGKEAVTEFIQPQSSTKTLVSRTNEQGIPLTYEEHFNAGEITRYGEVDVTGVKQDWSVENTGVSSLKNISGRSNLIDIQPIRQDPLSRSNDAMFRAADLTSLHDTTIEPADITGIPQRYTSQSEVPLDYGKKLSDMQIETGGQNLIDEGLLNNVWGKDTHTLTAKDVLMDIPVSARTDVVTASNSSLKKAVTENMGAPFTEIRNAEPFLAVTGNNKFKTKTVGDIFNNKTIQVGGANTRTAEEVFRNNFGVYERIDPIDIPNRPFKDTVILSKTRFVGDANTRNASISKRIITDVKVKVKVPKEDVTSLLTQVKGEPIKAGSFELPTKDILNLESGKKINGDKKQIDLKLSEAAARYESQLGTKVPDLSQRRVTYKTGEKPFEGMPLVEDGQVVKDTSGNTIYTGYSVGSRTEQVMAQTGKPKIKEKTFEYVEVKDATVSVDITDAGRIGAISKQPFSTFAGASASSVQNEREKPASFDAAMGYVEQQTSNPFTAFRGRSFYKQNRKQPDEYESVAVNYPNSGLEHPIGVKPVAGRFGAADDLGKSATGDNQPWYPQINVTPGYAHQSKPVKNNGYNIRYGSTDFSTTRTHSDIWQSQNGVVDQTERVDIYPITHQPIIQNPDQPPRQDNGGKSDTSARYDVYDYGKFFGVPQGSKFDRFGGGSSGGGRKVGVKSHKFENPLLEGLELLGAKTKRSEELSIF